MTSSISRILTTDRDSDDLDVAGLMNSVLESTGVDEDWACLDDGVDEDGLDDLTGVVEDTWAIFALSPWLPASSLRVSMMETVCT